MLVSDIIYSALRAARVLKAPGRGASSLDLSDGLMVLNDLIDQWAANRLYSWADTFTALTLTPNHQPHLIGPTATSPDFVTSATRPVRIESASLILTDSIPNVDRPINIRDSQWWNQNRVKALATNVPTDLYYEAQVPNGALYLWPVPTFAYGLRLETWVSLAQFTATSQTVTCPPAYAHALKLTLAVELCLYYGQPIPPALAEKANRARLALESNNSQSPRISTADIGTR